MKKIYALIIVLHHINNLHSMESLQEELFVPRIAYPIPTVPLGYEQPPVGTIYTGQSSSHDEAHRGYCIVFRSDLNDSKPVNPSEEMSFNFAPPEQEVESDTLSCYWQWIFCNCCCWYRP